MITNISMKLIRIAAPGHSLLRTSGQHILPDLPYPVFQRLPSLGAEQAANVAHCSYNVTPEELFDLFGKFGPVRYAMMTSTETILLLAQNL